MIFTGFKAERTNICCVVVSLRERNSKKSNEAEGMAASYEILIFRAKALYIPFR